MRTLIAAVDLSENAVNAARYAADMALAIEANLFLLTVVEVPATPAEAPIGYVFEQLEQNGRTVLDNLAKELIARTRGQVTINTILEVGGVELVLEKCARRLSPFAVVMGAPSGSFLRALSGSPVVDTARRLPYPVLVIPADAVFHRISRIVLACEAEDIGDEIPVKLSFLKELKELFDARFEIVHVTVPKNLPNPSQKVFEVYRWKEALREVFPELHFVQASTILEGVDKYLGENGSDWLMLFPKKHRLLEFHRSRSKPLLSHCKVPVMSIPE